MPLYEYHCSKCDKNFEVIQKFSDAPLEVHEGCGGPVERVLSAPAFQLKGSGWYITDYARASSKDDKSSGKADGATAESKGGSAEAKPGDSKTESKSSEPKSESKPAAKAD